VDSIIAGVQEHPYQKFISATAVMDYSFCQRYYYLKHLAGIPETVVSEEYKSNVIGHNLRADKIGTLVHRAIEQGGDIAGAREILRQLVQTIAPGKNRELIFNELDSLLVPYYESKIIQSLIAEYKVQKEVPFLARVDQNIYVKGFIDQLFEGADRTVIADLKTSQIKSPSQLEKKSRKYAIQLSVYEKAVQKVLGLKDVVKILLFLRTGQVVDVPSSAVEFDLSGTMRTASPDDCKNCSYFRLCSQSEQ
jgi:ATP-dependent exoDNAse (exonuclease V) beta subunit